MILPLNLLNNLAHKMYTKTSTVALAFEFIECRAICTQWCRCACDHKCLIVELPIGIEIEQCGNNIEYLTYSSPLKLSFQKSH